MPVFVNLAESGVYVCAMEPSFRMIGSFMSFLLPSLLAPARTPYGAGKLVIKGKGDTVTYDCIEIDVFPNGILSQVECH
jgi:hypothetical protein